MCLAHFRPLEPPRGSLGDCAKPMCFFTFPLPGLTFLSPGLPILTPFAQELDFDALLGSLWVSFGSARGGAFWSLWGPLWGSWGAFLRPLGFFRVPLGALWVSIASLLDLLTSFWGTFWSSLDR